LQAKEAALNAGARAVCLSGAGPGLISFAQEKHAHIGEAMRRAFAEYGLSARYWVLDVTTQGAQVS
jgi:homoserine kinase